MSLLKNVMISVTVVESKRRPGLFIGIYQIAGLGNQDYLESFSGKNRAEVEQQTTAEFNKKLAELNMLGAQI